MGFFQLLVIEKRHKIEINKAENIKYSYKKLTLLSFLDFDFPANGPYLGILRLGNRLAQKRIVKNK
ncbi:MAG: hypothetical protein EA341_13880 [Mongoliibacter sp.]|nr:MAG: hypothetical protein EA341_13880 [Mongoliibacter sp.]